MLLATYVIGDVHGCLEPLQNLLSKMNLKPNDDVWFVGDLVGRGDQEWEVLQEVASMPNAKIILGNHDLHFLAQRMSSRPLITERDPVRLASLEYLCRGHLALWHASSQSLCVHAGIWYDWDVETTMSIASEVEALLRDPEKRPHLFDNMYATQVNTWDNRARGWQRFQAIINIFTLTRTINSVGQLDFDYKGGLANMPNGLKPWYAMIAGLPCQRIVFGHWSALMAKTGQDNIECIDGGLVYGGELIATCLDNGSRITQTTAHQG